MTKRARPACPTCGRAIDAHSLEEIRACTSRIPELPVCRLTGPTKAQLELWRVRPQ